MDNLKTLISKHQKLEFPEFPKDDGFADWVSELSEIDGYYIGIAVSLVNGEKTLVIDKTHIEKLENALQKFSDVNGEDFQIYQKCLLYIESLKRIVSLLE